MSGGCVLSPFLRCLPILTSLTHGPLGSATSVIQAANSLINSLKVSQIPFFSKDKNSKKDGQSICARNAGSCNSSIQAAL